MSNGVDRLRSRDEIDDINWRRPRTAPGPQEPQVVIGYKGFSELGMKLAGSPFGTYGWYAYTSRSAAWL